LSPVGGEGRIFVFLNCVGAAQQELRPPEATGGRLSRFDTPRHGTPESPLTTNYPKISSATSP
ncbi:MAG: hypothetical protein ACK5MM_07265, partial [Planctomyces sp.]